MSLSGNTGSETKTSVLFKLQFYDTNLVRPWGDLGFQRLHCNAPSDGFQHGIPAQDAVGSSAGGEYFPFVP